MSTDKIAERMRRFQSEITLGLNAIQNICDRWGYDVVPSLLLRHKENPLGGSTLISNDSCKAIIECVKYIATDDNVSNNAMSPQEASEVLYG